MVRNGIHKQRRRLVGGLKAVLVVAGVVGVSGPAIGTAKDETSQQTGQQSLGVRGGEFTPQHNPSQLQSIVGTTDPEAKKDVAPQESGFVVGLCNFSVGDQVRVEGSDMGTITTIKQLSRRTNSEK